MVASGSPWSARRVSHETIQEVVRKTLLTYWNTVSFQALYARLAGWSPPEVAVPVADRPAIDRWLASRTQQLVKAVDAALDGFRRQRAQAGRSPPSSTSSPTGTSAGPGAGSGTAMTRRSPRCTRP